MERDADSDNHAAVGVVEEDGEFALPIRGRPRGDEEVVLATFIVQVDTDVNLAVVVGLLVLLVLQSRCTSRCTELAV